MATPRKFDFWKYTHGKSAQRQELEMLRKENEALKDKVQGLEDELDNLYRQKSYEGDR